MTNQVDLVIGTVLRRELLRRGYVVVPMAPSHEMQHHAQMARTGYFSNFCLLHLWLNLLLFADPEARPHLDELHERLQRERNHVPRTKPRHPDVPPPAPRKK